MNSTVNLFPPDLIQKLQNAIDEGMAQAARFYWNLFIKLLTAHWFAAMAAIFVGFIFALMKAMFGRWGTLGSLLYNFFYFGTLFIIGLIWGPEIFVSDYFHTACAVILYPICFWMSGWAMDCLGVRVRARHF